MIASLLLAVSLSTPGQYSLIKPFWHVPAQVKDMAFNQIQIDWIYQQRKNSIYRWESVLPQEDADLLDALNAEKSSVRRFARRHLKKMGFDAVVLCSWGIKAKSAELQEVCSNHLYSLYKCSYCDGTGFIERDDGQFRDRRFCRGCTQTSSCQGGSFYWYEKYHLTEQNQWTLRDIFGPTEPRKPEDE